MAIRQDKVSDVIDFLSSEFQSEYNGDFSGYSISEVEVYCEFRNFDIQKECKATEQEVKMGSDLFSEYLRSIG